MPANEENKELRDLVAESLKAKGVLGKVQAEIRASVFLALEEQDVFKDKSPFLNQHLKEFLRTPDGLMVLSLVREFLEFFNLEFSAMVFDPETHAGIDYTYVGRSKLAQDLSLDASPDMPLLAHIVGSTKPASTNSSPAELTVGNHNGVKSSTDLIALSPEHLSNGVNGDSTHTRIEKTDMENRNIHIDDHAKSFNRTETSFAKPKSKDASLTSLSNLPPLNNKNVTLVSQKGNELKALLDMGLNTKCDTSTDREKQTKSGSEENSDSVESEIEEEIASHNSNLSGVTAVSVCGLPKRKNGFAPYFDGSVNSSSVGEEFEKLKALSLSFVKDLPLNLLDCNSSPSSKQSYSGSSSSPTVFDLTSECHTGSEVDDLEDEASCCIFPSNINPHLAEVSNIAKLNK